MQQTNKSRIDKTEYTFHKSLSGTMYCFKNGKLHNDYNDKPAIIYNDGRMAWYKNGKYIRYTEDK